MPYIWYKKIKYIESPNTPSFNKVVVTDIKTICSKEFHLCNLVKFGIKLTILATKWVLSVTMATDRRMNVLMPIIFQLWCY